MKQFFLALILCTTLITGAQAQKFGYVNTALLLSELPEVKSADAQLEAYQKQLVAEGQAKVQEFEAKYQTYLAAANSGEMSKVEMAQKEQELTKGQQEIKALEQEVQDKIMTKRQELLNPILQTVDSHIQTIGKEGGYTFIFDMSAQGAMLYALESEDLTDQVRARMSNQ
jgi:outer membrane protein